ncbi:prolipoprotein diacylglyceryl transferase [Elizabethkingia sp. JS20170427COW]|nr:prolipoprotein diacylglyceryl transferase [Elizabethkingia sp. JS20170427COW]
MKFFSKFYLLVFILCLQNFFAQSYKEGLSDGKLILSNHQEVPIKIFATTWGPSFAEFANYNQSNALVILNPSILETLEMEKQQIGQSFTLQNYESQNFVLLDKDFKPTFALSSAKYLYKALDLKSRIPEGGSAQLKTSFGIWDPSTGIHLGFITLHYYSLMFVFAFGFGFVIMKKIFAIDGVDEKYLEPLFTWTLIGTILGARLGHVIFYQPELFKQDFWSVFLPIQTQPEFKFTGFSGLASHGATIALILTTLYYSFKIIKKNPFWVYDRLGIVVAFGGAFVRMGNFFNSEIIGKIAPEGSFLAVLFPQQSREYGITVPRYPTQLFEAIGYVLLFILLWFLYRKTDKKYQQGWLFGLFFIILWAIRFFVEFFKEPQGDEFIQFVGLNTGQVLSIPFMIAGFIIMIYSKKFKITK